ASHEAQRPQRLDSPELRHIAVEEHDVVPLLLERVERLLTIVDHGGVVAAAIENAADHLAVGRVVVGDQYTQFPRVDAAPRVVLQPDDAFAHLLTRRHRMQHIEKLPLVEGQLEYRRESGGQRLEPRNIGVARYRKYAGGRRVRSRTAKALRELRIFARAVEHRAVIGLRQADFGDEPRHTLLDVRDRDGRGPPTRERTVKQPALGRREADEQDPGAGELAAAGTHTFRLLLQLHFDPEGGAEANRAFQPDLAAHQADELLRDRSAQPCAAEAAGSGLVRLRKAFEDARLRLRRNTDPRVADGELE